MPGRLDELESTEDLEQMGVMSWGTLRKSLLTGRVTRDRTFDPLDVRHSAPWWVNADHEPAFKIMDRLNPMLEERGHSGLELAMGYLMTRKVVDTLMWCSNKESAIECNCAIGNLPSEDVITECVAPAIGFGTSVVSRESRVFKIFSGVWHLVTEFALMASISKIIFS